MLHSGKKRPVTLSQPAGLLGHHCVRHPFPKTKHTHTHTLEGQAEGRHPVQQWSDRWLILRWGTHLIRLLFLFSWQNWLCVPANIFPNLSPLETKKTGSYVVENRLCTSWEIMMRCYEFGEQRLAQCHWQAGRQAWTLGNRVRKDPCWPWWPHRIIPRACTWKIQGGAKDLLFVKTKTKPNKNPMKFSVICLAGIQPWQLSFLADYKSLFFSWPRSWLSFDLLLVLTPKLMFCCWWASCETLRH